MKKFYLYPEKHHRQTDKQADRLLFDLYHLLSAFPHGTRKYRERKTLRKKDLAELRVTREERHASSQVEREN